LKRAEYTCLQTTDAEKAEQDLLLPDYDAISPTYCSVVLGLVYSCTERMKQ